MAHPIAPRGIGGSGVQEITGTAALVVRIRKIYALDYLRGLSKTEEFGKAFAKSADTLR